jgi:polyphenol oxidase
VTALPATAPAVLRPKWPAPPAVQALFTLRGGGVSRPPFDSLNLGEHVGDAAAAVAENRRRLRAALCLPAEPSWLQQVHGARVLDLDAAAPGADAPADAALTRRTGRVCAVQVADCMPVLFAARDAGAVAAAHAGWRGLAAGVLEATVSALGVPPAGLMAWLGPAIGQEHFEVGGEVRAAFAQQPGAEAGFVRNARGRWQCDLRLLVTGRLKALGVQALFGGDLCTYADAARFFSYRREQRTGRSAALIWLA